MRAYKLGTKMVNINTKIVCNMCGYEMNLEKNEYEEFMTDMVHRFQVGYGYVSQRDGDIVYFDLCEECLEKIYAQFKIEPDVENFL